MGLISTAYDWLKSFMPRRGKGPGRRLFSAGLYGQGGLGWGTGWHSGDRREQALHYRQWTYIAVRAIANRVAGLTPNIAHVAGPHGPATKTVHVTRKSLGSARVGEQLAHCGDEHPLVRLFANPNPWDTSFDLWFELVMFLELCGIAYLWCPPSEYGLRSGLNTPSELWVVPSHWMWPRYDKEGISHYHCVPVPGGQFFTLPASEIIPLRYKSPVHKIDGWSPLQAGSEWSDAAESIDRSRFHQFKNGAFPLGAVELSEQYTDPTDAELESIYAKFFARLQGEHNYGKPIITPPGVKYTPLNINPAEMAYVESAEQLCTWVLSRHGVPKEIVGLQPIGNDLSWYAPMLQFDKNTLGPKLQYLGQALTQFLCPRYGPGLRIWWDDPAEDNPEARARKIELLMGQGLVTPAEVRSEFGYPPMSPEDEAKYCKLGKPDPPPAPSPVPAIPGVARSVRKGWREEDHPRADDGKFGSGGGGAGEAPDAPDDDDVRDALIDAEADWWEEDQAVERARRDDDARLEEARDAEDAADEAVDDARERFDLALDAARGREDAERAAARQAEDRALDESRAAEDQGRAAEEDERFGAYRGWQAGFERAGAEEQARRQAWDADLERRRAEPGADPDALDEEEAKEDGARLEWDSARVDEEERQDALFDAWHARFTAAGDRLDARREAEDRKIANARRREDVLTARARGAEDRALAANRQREDAAREQAAADRDKKRKAEDAELAARRAREDGQREAAREARRAAIAAPKKHLLNGRHR